MPLLESSRKGQDYGKSLLPFKAGAALLAHRSGAPVIPFSVKGTEELYPDDSKVFHKGRAAMNFGEARSFEKIPTRVESDQVEQTLGVIRQDIVSLQEPLKMAKVGRGLPFDLGDLTGTAIVKALSLVLLTVKWG